VYSSSHSDPIGRAALDIGPDALPALLQQAHVAIAQTDPGGRFTQANPRWLELLGYSEPEVLKLTLKDVTHPDSRPLTEGYMARLQAGEAHVVVEKRYVRKDGSSFWANATISGLRDAAGRFRGFIGLIVEASPQAPGRRIVESQNAALQLIISGARLKEIFEHLITVVEAEAEGDAVGSIHVFDATTRRLHHGAAPGLPHDFNRALDGISIDDDMGTWGATAADRQIVITRDIAAAPNWKKFSHLPLGLGLVAGWSMPIISAQGKILGAFGTYFRCHREPTDAEIRLVAMLAKTAALAIERQHSEQELNGAVAETARHKRLYETILSNTPDLVYVFDLAHRFTYANTALLTLWGRTWEDSIGKTCLELGYEPWHAAMHDREIEQVIATKRPIRGDVAFEGTAGRRLFDYIFVPVLGSSGQVEAIAGTTRDVTESRKAASATQFLADLVQQLSVLSDEAEIIRHTTFVVGRHFGAHRCYFIECLQSENLVKVGENYVRDAAPSIAGFLTLSDFGGTEWWQRFSAGDFAVADVERDSAFGAREVANYLAHGVRSYAVQPIRRGGTWTTILAVTDDHPRTWTSEELHLLENIAARVWPLVERARSNVTLRMARDEALAASRAKDDFLAALSHELRTPLNPVLLLASEAANNPALSPEIRADFESIVRGVSLEARLIDDLLDLTRITHDRLVLDLKPHDVHAILKQVLASMQPEISDKHLKVITRFEAVPTIVAGDDVRLQQVFWNLIKNAVKFTPSGGTITLSTRTPAEKPGTVAVEISDSGIGLTLAELTRIFDPFAQGEHSAVKGASPYGGLGLGLAISRKVAEMHSGSVTARSEGRDRGATFTVELPLAPTAALTAAAADGGGSMPPMSSVGRKILLVEDHEPSRAALAHLLTRRKMTVVQASSAAEALAKADGEKFDVVVSDIGLPDMTGYELMVMLRSRHALKGIALSGYGMEEDIARSRAAGFIGHLTKPVKIQALERALDQAARSEDENAATP
jgi:PAS domain S-box-containing protein